MVNNILEISNLKASYMNDNNFIQVLRGVNIHLMHGEILGIIGESGSGKTATAYSILRLIEDGSFRMDSGSILFDNMELTKLSEKEMRDIRGKRISYMFQDATAALNPYRRVGVQLKEVLKVQGEGYKKEKVINAMKMVGIGNAQVIYNMFPWQLSGGLCQRVVIAMNTLFSPEIIIADEPTTAIDASLQKKVLELLRDINKNDNSSIIIITHDFDVVKYICHRVIIMYGGLIMEEGTVDQVMDTPLHPYTKELLHCVKSLNENDETLYTLKGTAYSPNQFKNECPFYERCKIKSEKCLDAIPEIISVNGRKVRCILAEGDDFIAN